MATNYQAGTQGLADLLNFSQQSAAATAQARVQEKFLESDAAVKRSEAAANVLSVLMSKTEKQKFDSLDDAIEGYLKVADSISSNIR